MDIPRALADKLKQLDRKSFEDISEREFRPGYDLIGLKYLREKAGKERDLRELYRGRAPYELLQNADDAGAKRAVFILSAEGLAFAHDGLWFTIDNFRSLADGWSDKDPNQCIGHKGLGFRSVLDITPSPYLIKLESGEFFAAKFTWALNNGHIQEAFRKNSELRSQYEAWTKYGQNVCPIMAIPGLAKKQNLGQGANIFDLLGEGKYGHKFTTMFWFPADDFEIDKRTFQELSPSPIMSNDHGKKVLQSFLSNEVCILLPFLKSIEEVRVFNNADLIGMVSMPSGAKKEADGEITINTNINKEQRSDSFYQMRFALPIPIDIHNKKDTPKALKGMSKANVILSVGLKDGQPYHNEDARFHVYFPTEEHTGLGFTVHADFYVKPDRTRLMQSDYNSWLLNQAATYVAERFMMRLLKKYSPRSVFAALSPSGRNETFVKIFSEKLRLCEQPFIPTNMGFLKREEVVLPPTIDEDGFWHFHFGDCVEKVRKGKIAFIAYREDASKTRNFMRLAAIDVLESGSLVEFIEEAIKKPRTPAWWCECYSFMADDEKISRLDHSFFMGRKLIPTSDKDTIAVQKDSGLVVCLPPLSGLRRLRVPKCFEQVFVFLNRDLAVLLQKSRDTVRSWVLDRLSISRFEASDLLPRAIRGVAQQLYNGEREISCAELKEAWLFIQGIINTGQTISYPGFWQEIGRFPLPLDTEDTEGRMDPKDLVPAFLAYWPDSFMEHSNCLLGLTNLRRLKESFLEQLIFESGVSRAKWIEIFSNVGVSDRPKLLRYSRIVARDQELKFDIDAPAKFGRKGFSGERQIDENRAVIDALSAEGLWGHIVANAVLCEHASQKILQSLTLLEGLGTCTQVAEKEYESEDTNWSKRLWSLIKLLSVIVGQYDDAVFCPKGERGGHNIPIGSYLESQLNNYKWLPSSLGPTNNRESFARLSSRRLISSGGMDEELGDKLLPYVVVDNIDDLAKLQHLGVQILDDVESAENSALVRALKILGDQLSSEWGQEAILRSRGRCRLVRGAIQEIYRVLNQSQGSIDFDPKTKFATRSDQGVEFLCTPVYYAEPGSEIERAFKGVLPLFDADRPYVSLFERIGVERLIAGQTVNESFLSEEASVYIPSVRDEIINSLAPYFLAPMIAKSEKSKCETLLRRLRERFEVKSAIALSVSFSLFLHPSVERTVDFSKFYLQRRVITGDSARQEAHYVLYIKADDPESLSILDLDADALGESLSSVFLDEISEEIAGLFPRIAARYQHLKGDRQGMSEFLHYQLGISPEAQDLAWAMVSGEIVEIQPLLSPAPPPARIITMPLANGERPESEKGSIEEKIIKHQEELQRKTADLVRRLTERKPTFSVERHDQPTPEQKDRGRRGEEEIRRRMELPGGWEGFTILADHRHLDCGYDFLCAIGQREVKLEAKTFTAEGRVIVTIRELREAAVSQNDYYLVGVLSDEKPEHEWATFIICNPLDLLLSKGNFDIQAKLEASAEDIFGLSQNPKNDKA
jgi:hypothetical protein